VFRDADLAALGLRPRHLGLTENFLPPAVEAGLRAEATPDTFHWISQAEFQLYLGNTVLRDVDSNSMAHSLEVRVPFLARDLVEFAARLPGAVHLPMGGQPKQLLRNLAADCLPPEVLARPKRGFSLPIGEWMRGPLRDASEAAVDAVAACPLFESAAVRALWARFGAMGPNVFWDRALALVVLGSYLMRLARPGVVGPDS
jgi:asparagine synthetase B (glutamine-hydrolysing)